MSTMAMVLTKYPVRYLEINTKKWTKNGGKYQDTMRKSRNQCNPQDSPLLHGFLALAQFSAISSPLEKTFPILSGLLQKEEVWFSCHRCA
jgi:hypothetical protein